MNWIKFLRENWAIPGPFLFQEEVDSVEIVPPNPRHYGDRNGCMEEVIRRWHLSEIFGHASGRQCNGCSFVETNMADHVWGSVLQLCLRMGPDKILSLPRVLLGVTILNTGTTFFKMSFKYNFKYAWVLFLLHIHVCVYIYVYIYIYTHTHTHTPTVTWKLNRAEHTKYL
jgi:hypothetical protein